jgi:hypothetical protein
LIKFFGGLGAGLAGWGDIENVPQRQYDHEDDEDCAE